MRVVLIGPGDVDYHYTHLLKIEKERLREEIDKIAKALVDSNSEIVLLPDRGIALEVAKAYKALGGKTVLGTVPFKDLDFGIKHLEPYMGMEIVGEKLFSGFIDTVTWYKQDLTIGLFGDAILVLGYSLGSLGELMYAYYIYKLLNNKKPYVKISRENIHPEIRAGTRFPLISIIYTPFVSTRLHREIEGHIKMVGGEIRYVSNTDELYNLLTELSSRE